MTYVQELDFLLGKVVLTEEERYAIVNFSDEKVRKEDSSGSDYFNNVYFRKALRKIKDKGLYSSYRRLLRTHMGDFMDDFLNQINNEI